MTERSCKRSNNVERYELVGVINFLNLYPDFVTLLFRNKKDGKLYMQIADDTKSLEIEEFYPVQGKILDAGLVKFFNENIKTNDIVSLLQEEFYVGLSVVYAYQVKENEYLIGRYPEFREMILKYEFDDEFLEKELGFIDAEYVRKEIKEYIASIDAIVNL